MTCLHFIVVYPHNLMFISSSIDVAVVVAVALRRFMAAAILRDFHGYALTVYRW